MSDVATRRLDHEFQPNREKPKLFDFRWNQPDSKLFFGRLLGNIGTVRNLDRPAEAWQPTFDSSDNIRVWRYLTDEVEVTRLNRGSKFGKASIYLSQEVGHL